MHLDNSACNLASINLLKYLGDDGTLRRRGFKHTVEVVFTAQEILVGNADYPTEKIAETSRAFRQLGLGYANLGALLMARGHALRLRRGPGVGGGDHRADDRPRVRDERAHRGAHGPVRGLRREPRADAERAAHAPRPTAAEIDDDARAGRTAAARRSESWDEAVELGERHGVRNSQASVLAPTGTIGLMMDCDTTGIEPDLALTKAKKLVGGGTMFIVNQTIPRALRQLGYDDDEVDADRRLHRRAQDDHRCARRSRSSTCRCSRARWATTRSTTWVT